MKNLALFAIIVIACISRCADAANIALITRDDIAPYREFARQFEDAVRRYGNPDHSLRVFSLSRDDSDLTQLSEKVRQSSSAVLVCVGAGAADFCREHFSGTPRISCMIPSHRDLIRSVQAGALGISMDPDPALKFEALRALLPNAKTVGAVYDPAESGELIHAAAAAGRMHGMTLTAMQVSEAKDAPASVEKIMGQVDAFLLFYDRTILTPQTLEVLLNASFFRNVPVIGFSEKYAALGAPLSFEVPIADLAREAWNAAEICFGCRETCRDLRTVKNPGRLIVNKKVVEKMGLNIPERILDKGSIIE